VVLHAIASRAYQRCLRERGR